MKLLQNQDITPYTITAYSEKNIVINQLSYSQNLLILPESDPATWDVADFDSLNIHHFHSVILAKPDLLLIGTGNRHRFLPFELLFQLSSEKIGVEYMNTQAACRTFNLLISEGRRVALALFIGA